ncbi:uncharacterized protein DEA37_0006525 [Paragonimus westermani]|uniref:Integrase catalytic domain-containing protein n=1 Tax=Paragonimus westermani TaxID=34504 RepID=A0A5J4N5W6_9TREM|nr:uncharacterized protein DEA37_0006525 [Paragonimus westermani]
MPFGLRNAAQTFQRFMDQVKSKVHCHTVTSSGNFLTPDARFSHIHVDLVGLLPSSNGKTFMFTCVDRFTRWPVVVPLSDISSATVARAFLELWIANFGVPLIGTANRGSQFQSALFRSLTHPLGCEHIRTTAYHPASNGIVERFHRQLKTSLMAQSTQSWTERLPLTLLSIRSVLKEDIQCSTAELVYGTSLRLPVRRSLRPPFDGPFKVISRTDKVFTIERCGKQVTVSVDRLKPVYADTRLEFPSQTCSHEAELQRPETPIPFNPRTFDSLTAIDNNDKGSSYPHPSTEQTYTTLSTFLPPFPLRPATRSDLLALIHFLRHFRPYPLGKPFKVGTDHQSLQWLRNLRDLEGQVARWQERSRECDFVNKYRRVSRHGNADDLLRVTVLNEVNTTPVCDAHTSRAEDQVNDLHVANICKHRAKGSPKPSATDIRQKLFDEPALWGHWNDLKLIDGVLCCIDQSGLKLITPGLKVAAVLLKIHTKLGRGGQSETEAAVCQRY